VWSAGGFYVPEPRNVTARFLHQVFRGEKRLLRLAEVKWVQRPCAFRELSVSNLYLSSLRGEEATIFLPDFRDPSKLDRMYTINVS